MWDGSGIKRAKGQMSYGEQFHIKIKKKLSKNEWVDKELGTEGLDKKA